MANGSWECESKRDTHLCFSSARWNKTLLFQFKEIRIGLVCEAEDS